MIVYKLSEEQKNLLVNKEYTIDNFFNPIQDKFENWIITQEEVDLCDNSNFEWVKLLESIPYYPLINELY